MDSSIPLAACPPKNESSRFVEPATTAPASHYDVSQGAAAPAAGAQRRACTARLATKCSCRQKAARVPVPAGGARSGPGGGRCAAPMHHHVFDAVPGHGWELQRWVDGAGGRQLHGAARAGQKPCPDLLPLGRADGGPPFRGVGHHGSVDAGTPVEQPRLPKHQGATTSTIVCAMPGTRRAASVAERPSTICIGGM